MEMPKFYYGDKVSPNWGSEEHQKEIWTITEIFPNPMCRFQYHAVKEDPGGWMQVEEKRLRLVQKIGDGELWRRYRTPEQATQIVKAIWKILDDVECSADRDWAINGIKTLLENEEI